MTTSNASFSYFNRDTNATEKKYVKPASPGQIKFYTDLCTQRSLKPLDLSSMSFEDADKFIKKLLAQPTVRIAAPSQIDLIVRKIDALNKKGVKISVTQDQLSKLTGGSGGSADKWIKRLIELEKENNMSSGDVPSDKQVEFLVSMFFCPDVAFEEHNISRRINLDNGLWRQPTPLEFAQEIVLNMDKQQCNKFIDKYRGTFYTWKKTRISEGQMQHIRQLEDRLANLTSSKSVEISIDDEGNLVEVASGKSEVAVNAYDPLSDSQLLQFSRQDASSYIDMLKSELERKELYKFGEVADDSMTFEDIRQAHTLVDQHEELYEELKNLMFKLESVAGYADDELENSAISDVLDEVDTPAARRALDKIKSFMFDLIEHDDIDLEGLHTMTEKLPMVQRLLLPA